MAKWNVQQLYHKFVVHSADNAVENNIRHCFALMCKHGLKSVSASQCVRVRVIVHEDADPVTTGNAGKKLFQGRYLFHSISLYMKVGKKPDWLY